MSSIGIVVLLVRCSAGLLLCESVQSDNLHHADMETCRSEVTQIASGQLVPGESVVMDKCIYRMAGTGPSHTRGHEAFSNRRHLQTAELLRQTRR